MARTRREFLAALSAAAAWPPLSAIAGFAPSGGAHEQRPPGKSLRRHFIFDYFPWYGGPPEYEHWNFWDRHPPDDLASNYIPKLGAYDVRSRAVLEQHARWIADSGAGAVALSWWGRGSWYDDRVPLIMDVFRDHDLKVTFALEPYREDRGRAFASDVRYLLREYGEKRRYDALLLLRDADGHEGPVFKGFACIVPETVIDCHNVRQPVREYTPDGVWRAQTDAVREMLRGEFHHVTLLADSVDFGRTPACGFDGIALYDNRIPPSDYARYAAAASEAGLVFSFNVNPGYDSIEPRAIPPSACYSPPSFLPPTEGLDFRTAAGRERAAQASARRIAESFEATVRVQQSAALTNARRGFFLVYMFSFNEWHEGHAFEPMKDADELRPQELVYGYHNPQRGDYRLATLKGLLQQALAGREGPAAEPREVERRRDD
jgi:hypothetical protein